MSEWITTSDGVECGGGVAEGGGETVHPHSQGGRGGGGGGGVGEGDVDGDVEVACVCAWESGVGVPEQPRLFSTIWGMSE